MAEHEPGNAARTAAVCLPHDWLTWKLRGAPGLEELRTDRGDASGTGYWSPAEGRYRDDLLRKAFGRDLRVPTVLGPHDAAGRFGPGTGDNAGAALGLNAGPGDVIVSIGTSGVVSAVATGPVADASGLVAGFADASGHYLPLVCTLNAARVLDAAAAVLGVDHATLDELALSTRSDGLVLVPYLEGERTPNLPQATGALHGWRLETSTPAHLARAAVEGLLCHLAAALDALVAQGVAVDRVLLIGGGSHSEAVRRLAPAVLGRPVQVPPSGEYVADGAAVQAAWVVTGSRPSWVLGETKTYEADPTPEVRERYAEVCDLTDR